QQAAHAGRRLSRMDQRLRRAKRTVTSELLHIPGVGANRRRALLQQFGSLEGVKAATPEQIAELPGFSLKSATRILDILHGRTVPIPAPETATDAAPETATETVAVPSESK